MEQLIRSLGNLVYLDANVVVYAVEGYPAFRERICALLDAMDRRALCAVTSELTLAEVLVKPMIDKNASIERAYRTFLEASDALRLVPVSQAILIEAAKVRAETGLKLPDAIHLATATGAGCTSLLTNDKALHGGDRIPVRLLQQLA